MSDLAWRARPLEMSEKAALQADALSFYGDTQRRERLMRRLAWLGCGVGVSIGVVGLVVSAAVVILVARKPPQNWYFEVDRSTGYVTPSIGAKDAPELFDTQTANLYLRQYIEAREAYTQVTDEYNFRKVQLMSSADEGVRFVAWHNKDPFSPVKLGRDGHVDVANFHPELRGSGKAKTLVYDVRYQRREMRGLTVGQWEDWTASVEFQWHPELEMDSQQRMQNPAGMQVVSYHAEPDKPR